MPDKLSDFQQLLADARDGDVDALNRLVHEYESELTKVVKARLGKALRPYFDSVDLVQSVHKSVLFGLKNDKFEIHSPEHLVRLAAMIVRRKIARYWKRHRRQLRMENGQISQCDGQSLASLILSESGSSSDPAKDVELNDRIEKILVGLDPLDQRLIEMRLEGYSTAAAARKLQIDSDILRARLGRLRRKLITSGIPMEWF